MQALANTSSILDAKTVLQATAAAAYEVDGSHLCRPVHAAMSVDSWVAPATMHREMKRMWGKQRYGGRPKARLSMLFIHKSSAGSTRRHCQYRIAITSCQGVLYVVASTYRPFEWRSCYGSRQLQAQRYQPSEGLSQALWRLLSCF
jgi:hypothetical protein